MTGENLDASTKIGFSFLCVALVLFAGLMSGLTLGLLSLDRVELEVRALAAARERAARRRTALGARRNATAGAEWARRAGAGAQRHRRAEATSGHGHAGAARAQRAAAARPLRSRGSLPLKAFWFDARKRRSSSKRVISCWSRCC